HLPDRVYPWKLHPIGEDIEHHAVWKKSDDVPAISDHQRNPEVARILRELGLGNVLPPKAMAIPPGVQGWRFATAELGRTQRRSATAALNRNTDRIGIWDAKQSLIQSRWLENLDTANLAAATVQEVSDLGDVVAVEEQTVVATGGACGAVGRANGGQAARAQMQRPVHVIANKIEDIGIRV